MCQAQLEQHLAKCHVLKLSDQNESLHLHQCINILHQHWVSTILTLFRKLIILLKNLLKFIFFLALLMASTCLASSCLAPDFLFSFLPFCELWTPFTLSSQEQSYYSLIFLIFLMDLFHRVRSMHSMCVRPIQFLILVNFCLKYHF